MHTKFDIYVFITLESMINWKDSSVSLKCWKSMIKWNFLHKFPCLLTTSVVTYPTCLHNSVLLSFIIWTLFEYGIFYVDWQVVMFPSFRLILLIIQFCLSQFIASHYVIATILSMACCLFRVIRGVFAWLIPSDFSFISVILSKSKHRNQQNL